MSTIDQFLRIAEGEAQKHTDDPVDLAKIIAATSLGLTAAGWTLPSAFACVCEMAESLRVSGDGKVYCIDTDTGAARYGSSGLMTAEERGLELRADPRLREALDH